MSRVINATLTRCRDQKPLVVLDSSPFNGLEIRPADLLVIAQQLIEIAEMSAIHKTTEKTFLPIKVVLGSRNGMFAHYNPTSKGA